jgi:hypothetical protein
MTTIIQLRNRPAQKTARRTHGSLIYALGIVAVTVALALTQLSF